MQKNIIAGFDIGGAHLKVARAEDGKITAARTIAAPLRLGLDTLDKAFSEAAPLYDDARLCAFTMTGELSEAFSSRTEGVAALLDWISRRCEQEKRIYATGSGLVEIGRAADLPGEVASANWHATASLVARYAHDALFIDMGSTTTDIIAIVSGKPANDGYSDAERLASGELVYTGFVRSFPFALVSTAPVQGRFTPLMNEYFATMADIHRVLGVLRKSDDQHRTADGKEKTLAASTTRVARTLGRDVDEMNEREWRNVARWFSEHQLRLIHDAAFLVGEKLPDNAPVVGAGIGRWQIERLARRLDRPFIDLSALVPANADVSASASDAAPAAAVALLAGSTGGISAAVGA